MTSAIATYNIGKANITRVTETLLTTLTPAFLYPDWDASILDKHDHINCVLDKSKEHIILSMHTWVIELNGQIILIDTGIGNGKNRPFSTLFHRLQTPFLEKLETIGVYSEKVDHVLLTHLHADHVGWNTQWINEQWVPTFPNAKYAFPQTELDYFATKVAGESKDSI
jgi:glyoxylase-like metal-dependent hydrolase (beta-lactamase superfamily II)